MSDKTLFNQDLTLSNLTIDNSQYVGVSGYVPSSANFSSSKTGITLNGVAIDCSSATIGANVLNQNGITTPDIYLNTTGQDAYNIYGGLEAVVFSNSNASNNGGIVLASATASASMYCTANATMTINNSIIVPTSVSTGSVVLESGANDVSLTCSGNDILAVPNISSSGTINATQIVVVNNGDQAPMNCYKPNVLTVANYVQASGFIGGLIGTNYVPSSSVLIQGTQSIPITFNFPGYQNASTYIWNFVPLSDNVAGCVCIGYSLLSQSVPNNTATFSIQLQVIGGDSSVNQINVFGVNTDIPAY
jgi:hypothetical protein